MQYFDLNIPYLESDNSISNLSSKSNTRLNQTAKLMAFGYSGIAYNRTINGAMSQSDRCTISPFPLPSLCNGRPFLSTNVEFHRRLLGVSEKCAFRQYTRLTLVVETATQASVLNSGNPILKTYDLIAVRPLNQNTFDIACQTSQVDLISIDLAKFSFRLKLPMVKAAMSRGVYFEITYSGLMQDHQQKRNLIKNAKLLVEWTHGKNLIVSSAAPSVLELRGPNDVVNLTSLFGLRNEFAKATISKNCRLLLANALRKKQFHKEVIRVEEIPAGAPIDPKEPWIVDHIDWDPLSSGEGDLRLEDMAKAFAEFGKVTGSTVPSKDDALLKKSKKPKNSTLCSGLMNQQNDIIKDFQHEVLPDFPITTTNAEGFRINFSTSPQTLKKCDALETSTSPVSLCELNLKSDVGIHVDNVLFSNSKCEITSKDDDLALRCVAGSRKETFTHPESLNQDGFHSYNLKAGSGDWNKTDAGLATEMQSADQSNLSSSADLTLDAPCVSLPEVIKDPNVMNFDVTLNSLVERNISDGLPLIDQQLVEAVEKEKEYHTEVNLDSEELVDADAMLVDRLKQAEDGDDLLHAKSMLSNDSLTQSRKQVRLDAQASLSANKSEDKRVKRRRKSQLLRFPFKRLLQSQFKKSDRT